MVASEGRPIGTSRHSAPKVEPHGGISGARQHGSAASAAPSTDGVWIEAQEQTLSERRTRPRANPRRGSPHGGAARRSYARPPEPRRARGEAGRLNNGEGVGKGAALRHREGSGDAVQGSVGEKHGHDPACLAMAQTEAKGRLRGGGIRPGQVGELACMVAGKGSVATTVL